MKQKTKIHAEDGKQELRITRVFQLPIKYLFRAYVESDIVEKWMGTKVLKLENKRHGSYEFVTTDPKGNQHKFSGTIHEFVPNEKITRTFEMENTDFPVQLEFLTFEKLSTETSQLHMQIVFQSVEARDDLLKLPFAQGLNLAHDRLQEISNQFRGENQ